MAFFRRICALKVILLFLLGSCPLAVLATPQNSEAQGSDNASEQTSDVEEPDAEQVDEDFLRDRAGKEAIKEALKKAKKKQYQSLPGGVYRAPKIYAQLKKVIRAFKKTKLVDADSVYDVFIASAPEVNAWVAPVNEVSSVKAFHVVVTYGLIEAICKYSSCSDNPEDTEIKPASLPLLAGVLAHEFGHIQHQDLEKFDKRATAGVHFEFDADYFAAELLYQAGYDPVAMIDVLKLLQSLHDNKSLAHLVHSMLDEHPKSSYRIANIEPIVGILSSSERIADGESTSEVGPKVYNQESIDRSGPEHATRTSYKGLQKFLGSREYQSANFSSRLRLLETFSSFKNNQTMAHRLYTTQVQAYSTLLKDVKDVYQLDQLMASLNRFQGELGQYNRVTSERKHSSVKTALRELKQKIIEQQVQYGGFGDLTTKNLLDWSRDLDREIVLGVLNKIVSKTDSVDGLNNIIDFILTYKNNLVSRMKWYRDSDHARVRNPYYRLLASICTRNLSMTMNWEETLDFYHGLSPLLRDDPGNGRSFDYIHASMTLYTLTHENVKFGSFLERMKKPRTAQDRSYSTMLKQRKDFISELLLYHRGLGRQPDPSSKFFSYNIGKRFRGVEDIDADTVLLLYRSLNPAAVSIVFNDLAKKFYTLEESLQFVMSKSTHSDFWDRHKLEILKRNPQKHQRELQTQIKKIETTLHEMKVEGFEVLHLNYTLKEAIKIISKSLPRSLLEQWEGAGPVLLKRFAKKKSLPLGEQNAKILSLLRQQSGFEEVVSYIDDINSKLSRVTPNPVAKELSVLRAEAHSQIKNNIIQVSNAFTNSSGLHEGVHFFGVTRAPQISQKWINLLDIDERIAYFDALLQSSAQRYIYKSGKDFIQSYVVYEEAIDEMVSEGTLTELAKEEYLNVLTELNIYIDKFLSEEITELSEEFFNNQRRLRSMTELIGPMYTDFNQHLTEEAFKALQDVTGLYGARLSAPDSAMSIVNRLIGVDKAEIRGYLENPKENSRISNRFESIGNIAKVVMKYEGMPKELYTSDLDAMSLKLSLVRDVFDPMIPRKNLRTSGTYIHFDLDYEQLIGKETAFKVMRFGPGFTEYAERKDSTSKSLKLLSYSYSQALVELWPIRLIGAVSETDPQMSLTHILNHIGNSDIVNEETTRFFYSMLTRSIETVKTKEQMNFFVSVLSSYLYSHDIGLENGLEILSASLEDLVDFSSLRYREQFYDRLVDKIEKYQSWEGQQGLPSQKFKDFKSRVLVYLDKVSYVYLNASILKKQDAPRLFNIWFLRNTLFPELVSSGVYIRFWTKVREGISRAYTKNLVSKNGIAGPIKRQDFMIRAQGNTPWSEGLDNSISEYVRAGDFGSKVLSHRKRREIAIELTAAVRSLKLRAELYEFVLAQYGEPKYGLIDRVKGKWNLYKAYKDAEVIWTKEVIEELEKSQTIFEAFKITEKAWESFAKKRCTEAGISRTQAYAKLQVLYTRKQKVESPYGGEVEQVFQEGSRHRDDFLERHAKKRNMNYEQIQMLNEFKSKNALTPYHRIAKAMFEVLDEYISRLTPSERVKTALYLAGFDKQLDEGVEFKLRTLFYSNGRRKKALKNRGFYFTIQEIKTLFQESHADEQALAFRSLFTGHEGIGNYPEAEKELLDRLLFSDPNMPEYLKGVLNIYTVSMESYDRSILISWALANGDGKDLSGPEVLNLIVEKGGVVAAKLAQLVASHGFKLPEEYQVVLEVFKGQAQNVDKIDALQWIADRLPREKYMQIKWLGKELGSGSLKLAYLAKLKDGRQVVVKLARLYANQKATRELLLMRNIIKGVQGDPKLHIEGLDELSAEVERIITEEMNFAQEERLEVEHKQAYQQRPALVKLLGNQVRVYFPQPLEGWSNEEVLVEEYVEAKDWDSLPDHALFGWSKERLAKAAISEILNQIWSFVGENERRSDGKIIIDIDPHEQNQLAKGTFVGKKMVNIDLGQSVRVAPEVIERIATVIFKIDQGDYSAAASLAKEFMKLETNEKLTRFEEELNNQSQIHQDAVGIFTKALEEVELEGISLKADYLFWQKLFATLVGLNSHVKDQGFITKQTKRIIALRAITQPKAVIGIVNKMKSKGCESTFLP